MTRNIKSKGFTIVELLIVIVVIAILAAITIVAYNGIQQRARGSASQASAETVQKKAEAANAIKSSYPKAVTDFTAQQDSDLTGSGITFDTGTSMSAAPASPQHVIYLYCSDSGANQYKILYWNYGASPAASASVTGGDTSSSCTTWANAVTTAKVW